MGFISSNQIAVYPCGRRSDAIDPAARLNTEFNVVSIINRLVDNDSFVVPIIGTIQNSSQITFNIHGYLFRTTVENIIIAAYGSNNPNFSVGDRIYAEIVLQAWSSQAGDISNSYYYDLASADIDNSGLMNLDNDDSFIGLNCYCETADQTHTSANTTVFELNILNVETTTPTYTIPDESLIKFKTQGNHRSVVIDDGDLDD